MENRSNRRKWKLFKSAGSASLYDALYDLIEFANDESLDKLWKSATVAMDAVRSIYGSGVLY